ncbi:dolichyl-diphosphooligosaccharide--protein glycosyltransferase subunit 1 [Lethenteron reissneri]|uniref:dolichyl-diphosphooligosaccharide--protein glycosyltransferase subunit 1 n=1 Tax=Lethenteron reissneri TaxID=7753 RepID=UPI002AB62B27|nr:dolichyl-diphosphooligosaccharide--protein glycosyltransferase subunit 1 [Lethenteron reissneri]
MAPAATLTTRAFVLCSWALLLAAAVSRAEETLVNEEVRRLLDLSTHVAKSTADVTLLNRGAEAATHFFLVFDAEIAPHLAFVGAKLKSSDDDDPSLLISETTIKGHSGPAYKVHLASPLGPGERVTVATETVFSHSLSPFPSKIAQTERQLVVFEGNHYFYSPYPTLTQNTRVRLASKTVESYSKLQTTTKTDDSIEYGPYTDVAPFSYDPLRVHYENNSPFLTVTRLTRVIEVSHWGNIAVEETLDLRHSGAVLQGPFSRYDYQRQPDSGVSSIKSFKTILPAAAQDVYYRDEIGNISTSNLLVLDDSVEMEVRPRFPLFGGWKTHYYIGYNLPSYEYLFHHGEQYALKMRFVDHVFDDQVIDDLTVKIILPEGAKNIEVQPPYSVSRSPDEQHFTYLDTFGRPVIVAHKSNLVENHIQDFVLYYTFNKVLMLQEPLLVVAAFYILFFTVIVYVRLDFSITKDPAVETRMKVASIVEQTVGLVSRRLAAYRTFDEAVSRYKSAKETAVLAAARKQLDAEHRSLTNEIAGLQSRLKTEGSDAAEKVAELQRLDSGLRELVNKAGQDAERLVQSKLAKQPYLEAEKLNTAKRQEVVLKIDGILDAL